MNVKLKIPISKLFEFFGYSDFGYNEEIDIDRHLKIKTPNGQYTQINALIRKVGTVATYTLEDGISIRCDERHLVKSNGTFHHIDSIKSVDTIYGNKLILSKNDVSENTDVFDMALNSPHEYITASGIISHNTTLSKLIVNSIECDYIIINASDENNVDTVRGKIKNFASSQGFKPYKIVVLDECLDENTLVSVIRKGKDVSIPIRDLDEHKDLVKSYNTKRNKVEYRPFYLWDKGIQDVYEIELENGECVICTADHKWYVENSTGECIVVKASELHKYNHILSP